MHVIRAFALFRQQHKRKQMHVIRAFALFRQQHKRKQIHVIRAFALFRQQHKGKRIHVIRAFALLRQQHKGKRIHVIRAFAPPTKCGKIVSKRALKALRTWIVGATGDFSTPCGVVARCGQRAHFFAHISVVTNDASARGEWVHYAVPQTRTTIAVLAYNIVCKVPY
jgi:hypothetical protein